MKADTFVFVDQVQYVKGLFCNRNKIKKHDGELMVTVPVKKSKGTHLAFNELEIDYSHNWQIQMLNTFKTYYAKAPYFKEYYDLMSDIILKAYITLHL